MITYLKGLLAEKSPTRIVMDVNGVGYEVLIPLSSFDRLPSAQQDCRVLTYHYVREDTQTLYGFCTEDERRLFEKMLGVSGIGPKLALGVLSGLSPRELKTAVIEGDIARLSSISGVGKKTAERLVIELKDKISAGEALEAKAGEVAAQDGDSRSRDALMALLSLGYKQAEAQKMVRHVATRIKPEDSVEDIVRRALTSK